LYLAELDDDIAKFQALGGVVDEVRPQRDSAKTYAVDHQYVLMNLWAFRRITDLTPSLVYDFASKFEYAAFLATQVRVLHYDIREPDCLVPGLEFRRGDLTSLPIDSNAVRVASCLHVAEHIGLGRYGDEIDPKGFEKACAELGRVMAPGGSLLFAVPVGRPRVVFNAHRVLSSRQVLDAFPGLKLREFSGISSQGKYAENIPADSLDFDSYGCGLFHLVKEPNV
jgi:SAM-dependent methyltransferase